MKLFGTDGIRTRVGQWPLTAEDLPRLGRAIALWAQEKYGDNPHFLVVRDTRASGSWVKAALASGLLRLPVTLYDGQVLPTPAVYHIMKGDPLYNCGIIISASHNPAHDNGIKIIGRSGKLSEKDEQCIAELMNADYANSFDLFGIEVPLLNAEQLYRDKILSYFKPAFLKNQTIVIDCAHGATYEVAPAIFKELGADVIALNTHPDGYNINKNCGALHLEGLQAAVQEHQAVVGFAFDGDGDRVMAVNSAGTILDGDDILAVLLEHPDYKTSPAVVSTSMANQGFEAHLASLGKKLIRTNVGDKYVSQALNEHRLPLGGEPSGHILLHDLIPTGDGILAALKIMETMIMTGNYALKTFKKYPQVLINVPIREKKALNQPPLSDIIQTQERRLAHGRLLVRYSGTESLVRVMVEDADGDLATAVAHQVADHLASLLS
jgi:phosphoglucosamine mutase